MIEKSFLAILLVALLNLPQGEVVAQVQETNKVEYYRRCKQLHQDSCELYRSMEDFTKAKWHFDQVQIFKDSLRYQEFKQTENKALETYAINDLQEMLEMLEHEKQKIAAKTKENRIIGIIIFGFLILSILIVTNLVRRSQQQTARKIKELSARNARQQIYPDQMTRMLSHIEQEVDQQKIISAQKSLKALAHYMRQFLENSQHQTVSLKKEVELLFLHTELLRQHDHHLSIRIEIDESLDLVDIQVPSLALIAWFTEVTSTSKNTETQFTIEMEVIESHIKVSIVGLEHVRSSLTLEIK